MKGEDFDFRTMMGRRPPRRFGNVTSFRRRRRKKLIAVPLIAAGLILGATLGWGSLHINDGWSTAPLDQSLGIGCVNPTVTDGDTLRCGSTRIRLSSIDAPEMPGHCRKGRVCTPGDPHASTENLRQLVEDEPVQCRQVDTDRYGRAVAFCSVQGVDLSCAQVEGGFAVERYGVLEC